MVDTAVPSAVFIAIVLSLIPHDVQYGPQAALIAEAFTPPAALQRFLTGLSTGVGDRGRACPPYRDRVVRGVPLGLCDLDLYRRLDSGKSDIRGIHARLHRKGYFHGV